MNTLFVCTANTCRSPAAAAMMRQELAEKLGLKIPDLENHGQIVRSAGPWAHNSEIISGHSVEALRELGYYAQLGRSARPLSPELVEQADSIYAMTRWHIQRVLEFVPQAASKIQLLLGDRDIDDPLGSSYETYLRVARQIQTGVKRIASQY